MHLGFYQTPINLGGLGTCTGREVGGYSLEFTQSDLVNDSINLYHSFGTESVIVQVYDENNQLILPSEIIINSENDVDVLLTGGTPISGTWRANLLSNTGGCGDIGAYTRFFTQEDLTNDILTVAHALSSLAVVVQVYDGANKLVYLNNITVTGEDTVEVDLSGVTPISGNWHVTVLSVIGSVPSGPQIIGTGMSSLIIEDEGVPLPGGITTLNFVGVDVLVKDMGQGVANVYIPSPNLPEVSHPGTQEVYDGQNFPQILLGDIVTSDYPDNQLSWSITKTDGSSPDFFEPSIDIFQNLRISYPSGWTGDSPISEVLRFKATDPIDFSGYTDVAYILNPSPPVLTLSNVTESDPGPIIIDLNMAVSDINHGPEEMVWGSNAEDLTLLNVSITGGVATITPKDLGWTGAPQLQESVIFSVKDPKGLGSTGSMVATIQASPPVISSIPSQSRVQYSYPANPLQGTTVLFDTIPLDDYVEDNNHLDEELSWSANKEDGSPLLYFSVVIDSNRVASVSVLDNDWAGSEVIRFTAEDPKGYTDYEDVLFTVTAPEYVSNFNTQDGSTDASVLDSLTNQRNIPSPTSEGTPFKIGDWLPGSTQNVLRDPSISYTSLEPFLIGSTTTSITAELLDSDEATVLAQNSLNNITSNSSVIGDVSITISGLSYNYNLQKAYVLISFSLQDILPNGGRGYVRITHINETLGSFQKTQSFFYDPDNVSTVIGSVQVQESTTNLKYLSGVRLYDSGSTLKSVISGIENINNLSYPDDILQLAGDFPLGSTGINISQLTDWDFYWDKISSYTPSSNIPLSDGVYSLSGVVSARVQDWEWGSWVDSSTFNILVDTSSSSSSRIFEDFKSETYRYESNCSTSWDSTQNLNTYDDTKGLQVHQGRLIYRSGDFTSFHPSTINQPDYSGYGGEGTYYRFMWHTNVSHSNGIIRFSDYNFTESEFQAGAFLLDISLDGVSWYSVNNSYFGGSLNDGDGCRVDIASNNITNHDRVKFTLGTGGFTSASSNWGVFIRIRYPSGSTTYLGQVEITDWV